MDISLLYQLFLDSDGVSTDSRSNVANTIFFALQGPNFDGSQFIPQVLENGAHSVVTSSAIWKDEKRVILVENVLDVLQKLANYHRVSLALPVFAITGSNGKTTTKALIHSVLSEKYQVLATEANYNNLLGLPLTILRADKTHEIMVLEMGSNAFGEIEKLCSIAEPDYGLITNIGAAHLEGFDSLSGVLKEKTSLYRAVGERDGLLFVPGASPELLQAAQSYGNYTTYQLGEDANSEKDLVQVDLTQLVPEIRGLFESSEDQFNFRSNLMGEHNAQNCAAAIAVGIYFDVSPARIVRALSNYRSTNNRSQIIKTKNFTIILDAYNANPVSMDKALEMLDIWPCDRKVVILGDMKELGAQSSKAHAAVAKRAMNGTYDQFFLVGSEFQKHADCAFTDIHELVEHLKGDAAQFNNSAVLIKGSRSMGLEQILPFLSINLEQI